MRKCQGTRGVSELYSIDLDMLLRLKYPYALIFNHGGKITKCINMPLLVYVYSCWMFLYSQRIKGAISEKQQDLLEKLKNKSYIAVQYADKRIIGKGHAVGITYYIDLSNGSIIEIYKTR